MSCIFRRKDSIFVNLERSSTVRVSFPSIVRTWIHIVAPPSYASDKQVTTVIRGNKLFSPAPGLKIFFLNGQCFLGLHCVFLCRGNVWLARAGGASHEVAAPSKSREVTLSTVCSFKGTAPPFSLKIMGGPFEFDFLLCTYEVKLAVLQ